MRAAEIVQTLDEARIRELYAVVTEADIARQMGNKNWRDIIAKKREASTGKMKKVYAFVYKNHGACLDAVFAAVKDIDLEQNIES